MIIIIMPIFPIYWWLWRNKNIRAAAIGATNNIKRVLDSRNHINSWRSHIQECNSPIDDDDNYFVCDNDDDDHHSLPHLNSFSDHHGVSISLDAAAVDCFMKLFIIDHHLQATNVSISSIIMIIWYVHTIVATIFQVWSPVSYFWKRRKNWNRCWQN